MTTRKYDVVVVGGGPAGATAAYYAVRRGLRVLIIDKTEFPRSKTCGDSLSPRALSALTRTGVRGLAGYPITSIRAVHPPSGRSQEVDVGGSSAAFRGATIVRRELDAALLAHARSAGAECILGRVRRMARDDSGRVSGVQVTLESGERTVTARHVVCAAGAAGAARLTREIHDRVRSRIAIAARTYAVLGRHAGHAASMCFPPTPLMKEPLGYSWVFPTSPSCVNVGAGYVVDRRGFRLNPRTVLAEFIAWLRTNDPRFDEDTVWGVPAVATVPVGTPNFGEPGLLLVGDAAAVANPLTAEGIAMALESGESAGHAAAEKDDDVYDAHRCGVERLQSRAFRIKRDVDSVYASPHLLVGRGADVLVEPHRTVGTAMSRVILDLAEPPQDIDGPDDPSVSLNVRAVRGRVRDLAGRRGVLSREVVDELWAMPELGLGRATRLACAARAGSDAPVDALPTLRLDILTIIETLVLVAAIQRDLVVDGAEPRWGRNSHTMLLADTLNANLLSLMGLLPTRWMRELARVGRALFRADAAYAAGVSGELEQAYARLYTLAVFAGAKATTKRGPESEVLDVVRLLAASSARSGNATLLERVESATRAVALMSMPVRQRMATLVTSVATTVVATGAASARHATRVAHDGTTVKSAG